MSCRETQLDNSGEPAPNGGGLWHPCDDTPPPPTLVSLLFDDGQQVSATTDDKGNARFALSSIHWGDATLKSAQAAVVLPSGERSTVSLSDLSKYSEWKTDFDKREQARREQEEATARQAERAANSSRVHELQQKLAGMRAPWTKPRIVEFASILDKRKEITDELEATDRTSLEKVDTQIERLRAPIGQAAQRIVDLEQQQQEARDARDDQTYIANGWTAMTQKLVSPATASLISSSVILRCPRGRVIMFTFDSQNRMGALLRSTGVVKINAAGGFIARIEGEEVAGFDAYGILLRSAQAGDCKDMQ
jgi:hypothetical protein